ncbi:MAG: DUF1295 domain-containing protein [Deltaproteobacteria bacterium]|nr:DUF1295 domain-containing protein [Deltaproteobacteria bacterium]
MALKEELEKAGIWLFRWRSYLPLLLTGIFLVGLRDFDYPGHNHDWDLLWETFCLLVSFFGLGIRVYVVGHTPEGTSGRNTGEQKTVSLNVAGLYSIVRHPLYLGNFFIWLGISLLVRLWWLSLLCALIFWLYYERIMFAEEEFLRNKFAREFEEWSNNTPCFIPRFNKWKRPTISFSLRKALKDEYSGFFAIIASFTFLEVVGDIIIKGTLKLDLQRVIIFFIGLSTYLILRTLKKKGLLTST